MDRRVLMYATVTGVLFWVGAAAVIAPVTARNYAQSDRLVLITSHGGINFYIGNNPQATGWYSTPHGFLGDQKGLLRSSKLKAQQETRRAMSDPEVSDYWFRKGKAFIFDRPANALLLFLKKLYLFWNYYEKSLEGNIYFLEPHSTILRFMPLRFGILAPFALLGLLLMLKRWKSEAGLLSVFVIVYMATLVLFFVTARYRIVVVPFMLLHAAHGAWWCVDRLRGREWARAAPAIALLAAAIFVSNSSLFGVEGIKTKDLSFAYSNAGNVLLENKEYEAAIKNFEKAIELNPAFDGFHIDLGVAHVGLGSLEAAAGAFENACRISPENPMARLNLALTYHKLARREGDGSRDYFRKAETEYLESIRLNPNLPVAYTNLLQVYLSTGQTEKARELQQRIEAMKSGSRAPRRN